MPPQVLATNSSEETANVTSHGVALPAGITAGKLLIVLFAEDGPSSGQPNPVNPGGFTQLGGIEAPGSGFLLFSYYRRTDGGEGPTLTISTPVAERSAHQSFLIDRVHPVLLPALAINTGNSANANPPSLNPSAWNIEDVLWFAVAAMDADASFSADPTDYADAIENSSTGTTAGVRLRSLRRAAKVAAEDPSPFTNTNRPWGALTIGVPAVPLRPGRRAFRDGL